MNSWFILTVMILNLQLSAMERLDVLCFEACIKYALDNKKF